MNNASFWDGNGYFILNPYLPYTRNHFAVVFAFFHSVKQKKKKKKKKKKNKENVFYDIPLYFKLPVQIFALGSFT